MHLAAETHVDRSIDKPSDFIQTNVIGTSVMLECAREYWNNQNKKNFLFHHISTDEVYGSLNKTDLFTEQSKYDPSSPYSASKASSDHLVRHGIVLMVCQLLSLIVLIIMVPINFQKSLFH